jgi:hypothetical protein
MPGSEPTEPLPLPVHDVEVAAPEDTVREDFVTEDSVTEDQAAGIHPEDPDDEWRSGPVRRGVRLAVPTAVLAGLLAVAAGFWGGAMAESHHNPSTTSQVASLANRFASARGAGGFSRTGTGATGGAGGGAATAAATGIVTGIQGQTLYLTGANGSLIKVTLGPSATIEQTAPSTLAGLQTGNTAVVQGTKNPDGSVTATAIVSSPATSAPGAAAAGG